MRIATCRICHRVLSEFDQKAQLYGIAMRSEPAVQHLKHHGITIDGFKELKRAVKVIVI